MGQVSLVKDVFWYLGHTCGVPKKNGPALYGIPGIRPIHDDVLIFGCGETNKEAERDHDVKFRALMQRCIKRNIKLN